MSSLGSSNLRNEKPSFIKALPIYLVNCLLLILSAKTSSFLAIENIHVIYFLIPLYYWGIHKPFVMPLWFVFLAGLLIDLSVDSLLGLHAFSFVVFHGSLYKLRRIILSQPALYQFIIFIIFAVGFGVVRWIVMSLLMWQIGDLLPLLLSIVVNIVAYIPIMLVLKLLHRLMSGYGRG